MKGFTLIELLVVIAVIGVLAGVAMTVINPAHFRNQAQDSRRLADLATIQSAMELYFADHDSYPANLSNPSLPALPQDPDGGSYEYCVDDATTPMNYRICAGMEITPVPSDCRTAAYGCTKNCCLTNPF